MLQSVKNYITPNRKSDFVNELQKIVLLYQTHSRFSKKPIMSRVISTNYSIRRRSSRLSLVARSKNVTPTMQRPAVTWRRSNGDEEAIENSIPRPNRGDRSRGSIDRSPQTAVTVTSRSTFGDVRSEQLRYSSTNYPWTKSQNYYTAPILQANLRQ